MKDEALIRQVRVEADVLKHSGFKATARHVEMLARRLEAALNMVPEPNDSPSYGKAPSISKRLI